MGLAQARPNYVTCGCDCYNLLTPFVSFSPYLREYTGNKGCKETPLDDPSSKQRFRKSDVITFIVWNHILSASESYGRQAGSQTKY